MIVSLEEAKNWLRDVPEEDHSTVIMLSSTAELYLKNATGKTFDSQNELAKLFCLVHIADWYDNRESTEIAIGKTSKRIRFTVESILLQLQYCEGSE